MVKNVSSFIFTKFSLFTLLSIRETQTQLSNKGGCWTTSASLVLFSLLFSRNQKNVSKCFLEITQIPFFVSFCRNVSKSLPEHNWNFKVAKLFDNFGLKCTKNKQKLAKLTEVAKNYQTLLRICHLRLGIC